MTTLSSRDQETLSSILEELAGSLDISEEQHEAAVAKYDNVGAWLAADDSELRDFVPELYPQGSFRLGTVVRPLGRGGAYDIDLVCNLRMDKASTTQEALKDLVGDRLKASPEFGQLVTPSRRCWNLEWAKAFHMDVLPCIPNAEALPTGLLLTDTELTRWQKSNPIRYAEWFKSQMRTALLEKRAALAKSLGASIENVPEWRVKTPLQRVVQILKRHRDQAFLASKAPPPISIIITTLAAKAYANEADLTEALLGVVSGLEKAIIVQDGKWIIANPVEPGENFADKWNEDSDRREAFYSWLGKLRSDFGVVVRSTDLRKSYPVLEEGFGKEAAAKAILNVERRRASPTLAGAMLPLAKSEQLPSHAQAPTWPANLTAEARLAGGVYRSEDGPRIADLGDQVLPKRVSLKFELLTSAPPPFEIYWQVINTGPEAAAAGQLRGRIESGPSPKWESTKYRGRHSVEAFIVKGGWCVARTGRRPVKVS